jgi:hypothetical protein
VFVSPQTLNGIAKHSELILSYKPAKPRCVEPDGTPCVTQNHDYYYGGSNISLEGLLSLLHKGS